MRSYECTFKYRQTHTHTDCGMVWYILYLLYVLGASSHTLEPIDTVHWISQVYLNSVFFYFWYFVYNWFRMWCDAMLWMIFFLFSSCAKKNYSKFDVQFNKRKKGRRGRGRCSYKTKNTIVTTFNLTLTHRYYHKKSFNFFSLLLKTPNICYQYFKIQLISFPKILLCCLSFSSFLFLFASVDSLVRWFIRSFCWLSLTLFFLVISVLVS